MKHIAAYSHASSRGTFWIVRKPDGWHAMWESEELGTYASPEQAAEEIAAGTCWWPSWGNCGTVGLSDELGDWRPMAP